MIRQHRQRLRSFVPVFARGIRRITPLSGEPPLPDTIPATVPLLDAGGMPQPVMKEPTWRDDQSGELPFLIWLDDTSKDQFIGYVFALGAVFDAMAGDDSFPAATRDRLVADTRAIAIELMKTRTIGARETDLVIMDADGRPVTFHDLSAEEVTPGLILDQPGNAFNAVMSLGAMRTFFHITGDEAIGRYYYEELLGSRGYLDFAETEASVIYMGNTTNFSNINMAFVSVYGLLRYESDPDVAAQVRRTLEGELYAPELPRQAKGLKQSFFDFIYAGFREGGTSGPGAQAVVDGMETMSEYPAAPHWNIDVQNCDAAEIASRDCTASDGTTKIVVSAAPGRNGALVAENPVPMRLRPPSNFEWRSDPHRINGGGGDRLNPAGGFWGAYWLGRLLDASTDAVPNVSPHARPRPTAAGAGGAGGMAGTGAAGAGGAGAMAGAGATAGSGTGGTGSPKSRSGDDGGCGCRAVGDAPSRSFGLALALALVGAARRRRADVTFRLPGRTTRGLGSAAC